MNIVANTLENRDAHVSQIALEWVLLRRRNQRSKFAHLGRRRAALLRHATKLAAVSGVEERDAVLEPLAANIDSRRNYSASWHAGDADPVDYGLSVHRTRGVVVRAREGAYRMRQRFRLSCLLSDRFSFSPHTLLSFESTVAVGTKEHWPNAQ